MQKENFNILKEEIQNIKEKEAKEFAFEVLNKLNELKIKAPFLKDIDEDEVFFHWETVTKYAEITFLKKENYILAEYEIGKDKAIQKKYNNLEELFNDNKLFEIIKKI